MPEQRNLILAIVLSVTIIIAFQYFYELPRIKEAQRQQAQPTEQMAETAAARRRRPMPQAPAPPGVAGLARGGAHAGARERRAGARSTTARVHGSLALTGGRIDDLVLADYRETTAPDSPERAAAQSAGRARPLLRRVRLGRRRRGHARCPAATPLWQADGERAHAPDEPVTLQLGQRPGPALRAQPSRSTTHYMFTITAAGREHRRRAGHAPPLRPDQPLGHAARRSASTSCTRARSACSAASCEEIDYKRSARGRRRRARRARAAGWASPTSTGWPRWCPTSSDLAQGELPPCLAEGQDRYQADYLRPADDRGARARRVEVTDRLFAGAKEVDAARRLRANATASRCSTARSTSAGSTS